MNNERAIINETAVTTAKILFVFQTAEATAKRLNTSLPIFSVMQMTLILTGQNGQPNPTVDNVKYNLVNSILSDLEANGFLTESGIGNYQLPE